MIIDQELILSEAQAVTNTGATASTNIIDLTKAGDLDNLWLVVQVDTSLASGGAATVNVELQTDDNDSFSSPKTLLKTADIGYATLVAGYKLVKARVPLGVERFLRVVYNVRTAALTAGKFDAFFTPDVEVH